MQYGEGNVIISSLDFSYDEYGRPSEVIEYTGDRASVVQRIEYYYNSFGVRAGWTKYDSENKSIFTYKRKYTVQNDMLDILGADSPIQGESQYDSNGNLISLTTYDSLGNTIKGVFSEATEAVYRIYQKCSIADMIPETWR